MQQCKLFQKSNTIQRADIKSKSFRACCNNRAKHLVGKLDAATKYEWTEEIWKHPRRIKKLQ
jgi:hypothetical protein